MLRDTNIKDIVLPECKKKKKDIVPILIKNRQNKTEGKTDKKTDNQNTGQQRFWQRK